MLKFILFLFCFIIIQFICPETNTVYSNRHIKSISPEVRANTLNQLANSCRLFAIEKAYSLSQQALIISKKCNYTKGTADALYIFGMYNVYQHRYLAATNYFNYSLSLYKGLNDKHGMLICLQQMALINYSLSRNDISTLELNEALILANQIHDTIMLIENCLDFSKLFLSENKLKEAKRELYYGLYLSIIKKDLLGKARIYKQLGTVFLNVNMFDQALYNYQYSLNDFIASKSTYEVGTICTLISHIYELKSNNYLALYYNYLALDIRESIQQEDLITSSLLNIGHSYSIIGNIDLAVFFLKSGINKALSLKKNYLLEYGYKNLYQLYNRIQDVNLSLKYFQIYSLYKDSVANENNRKEISILETNRIINEQDKINTRLKNENSIQRLKIKNTTLVIFLVISLLVIMVFIVFFIYFLLIRNKKAKQIVEEINYKLQDEIKDKEIENEELSKSEQQYRFLADHSADLITLLDRNFNCLYISPACEHFFGYLQQEMIDLGDFRNLIHPDSMESFGIEYKAMLDYREPLRFNYQVTKKDGSLFWVESNINPIFDDITKELKAMLSVSRDVSNQMDTEEALMESARQKELMIREVHHRVKNNLGILASLVNMHKKEFSDHKTLDVFSDLQFRVRAMGLVHDQLYKSRNIKELPIGDYLSNLIYIVSTTFNNNQVEIHKDLYDELLDVEITLPLGLIVNELLTNAFKYAFPEYRKGNIWVTYKALPRRKKAGIPLRRITVKDDGIGLPADFEFKNRTSMGSQIIDLLSHQIEGELKIDGSKGAFFSITFPAER